MFAIDSSYEQDDHRAEQNETASTDPAQAAKEAGLRYADDRRPGITRRRAGKAFRYLDTEGRPIRDAETLARIKSLAIPPAWSDVWISPSPLGHIQATGRDDKGRKQYRYHPRWRTVRDNNKYDRMIIFGKMLPRIRKRTERDLALPGLPRRKVLAAVVRLLEVSLIRVGNDEYARSNHSFGLTTMRDRHAEVNGSIGPVQVSRQERRHACRGARGPQAGAGGCAVPGTARSRAVPVR